ncbi:MAG: hypothetical protein NNA22_03555 [Nitrospira sp.]|nr:hypothetical protein [Nitrospira sp.]
MALPPEEVTVFDGCYDHHEFENADYCICMDTRATQVMRADERKTYAADFSRYYTEIVFPDKGGLDDPRWRLYEMQRRCAR